MGAGSYEEKREPAGLNTRSQVRYKYVETHRTNTIALKYKEVGFTGFLQTTIRRQLGLVPVGDNQQFCIFSTCFLLGTTLMLFIQKDSGFMKDVLEREREDPSQYSSVLLLGLLSVLVHNYL